MLTRRTLLGGALALGADLRLATAAQAQSPTGKRIIVDCQIHFWKANSADRPWEQGSRPQIPEPMTIERALAMIDEAGVDRVVIVPPSLEGDRVDYGQEAARRYPGRFATMGRIALNKPDQAARVLAWRDQPAVLGVRLNITGEQGKWLTDGTAEWFWTAAENGNVPVMCLASESMPAFVSIAERHPKLPLIVDHMGVSSATMKAGRLAETVAETAMLARFPNVSVKVSSAPLFSKEDYPWRDVTPHIKRLYDVYGPQRCHWGTDVTNSFDKAPYKPRVTHFTEELPFLSEDDKDWIMGKSILQKLRWT